MSWQIYRGLRKLTLAIGCAVRNIFHLKSFIGPTPQIMLFNLHNDLLNRYVHGTLNILFINTLGFFFFNGKCYSSFPDHKTSREVSIRSRWLILRTAVIFFNGNYCSCPVSSGIVNITPILWFVYSLLLPGFFFFLTWCFITIHLIKYTDEYPPNSLKTWKTGWLLLEKFLSKWSLCFWKIVPILGNFR